MDRIKPRIIRWPDNQKCRWCRYRKIFGSFEGRDTGCGLQTCSKNLSADSRG